MIANWPYVLAHYGRQEQEGEQADMATDADKGPNVALIGKAGSRLDLMTPALVLDLDKFEANVQKMADHCLAQGVALRPHAKTHKCAQIAKAQMAVGAVGICCAKPGEAEALAAAGVPNILITSPIVQRPVMERMIGLNETMPALSLVIDNKQVLEAWAGLTSSDHPLTVLVDLDVGLRRTGVPDEETVVKMAKTIDAADGLTFGGVQAYAGHLQHVEEYADRKTRSEDALTKCAHFVRAIQDAGIDVPCVTGGGTGTFHIDTNFGVLTELQGGSYIFMDREYNDVDIDGGRAEGHNAPAFETSLAVQTTVISANQKGFVTTDAGFKSFAMDGPRPILMAGAPPDAHYRFMGDEHGCVVFDGEDDALEVGDTLTVMTPHCDPTVNLYDVYHCVRGDTLVDVWSVEGRGKSG